MRVIFYIYACNTQISYFLSVFLLFFYLFLKRRRINIERSSDLSIFQYYVGGGFYDTPLCRRGGGTYIGVAPYVDTHPDRQIDRFHLFKKKTRSTTLFVNIHLPQGWWSCTTPLMVGGVIVLHPYYWGGTTNTPLYQFWQGVR